METKISIKISADDELHFENQENDEAIVMSVFSEGKNVASIHFLDDDLEVFAKELLLINRLLQSDKNKFRNA